MADHKRLPLIQPWWLTLASLGMIASLVLLGIAGILGSGLDGMDLLTLSVGSCSLVFNLISIRRWRRNQERRDD